MDKIHKINTILRHNWVSDEAKAQRGSAYSERIRKERNDHQAQLDLIREDSQNNLKFKINSSQDKVNELSVTSGRLMKRYNR